VQTKLLTDSGVFNAELSGGIGGEWGVYHRAGG
jgi:hypothetical protein